MWAIDPGIAMTEDKKCHNLEKLRSPERMALLEVERVVQLTLEGCVADSILDIGTGSGLFAEGPPRSHRLKSDEVLNYASEAGFKHSQEIRLKHMVLFLLDQ
jgi:hypothetical protein